MKKRLMIISDRYPDDLTDGKHLRVFNLCKELCDKFECYFVGLSDGREAGKIQQSIPFNEATVFDKRTRQGASWRRLFRLSDAHYVSQSSPEFFEKSTQRIDKLARQWNIDATVTFEMRLAEIVITLRLPRILDNPDCQTLATERMLENRGGQLSMFESLSLRLGKIRARNRERYFLSNFARTVTISDQDRSALLNVSGVADSRVCVIPNGVSLQSFHRVKDGESRSRSIVFWGNLDFPPNWTAVEYFYENVFVPYLAENDVIWHIVGAAAGDRIKAIGQHEQVVLAGFQQDLPNYVGGMGAMINPMVEGGGLKNKVLEAFAMGIPVISSTMGAAAIDCVSGRHYLAADTPGQFAREVLKVLENTSLSADLVGHASDLVRREYDWSVIGTKYASVIEQVLDEKCSE